MLRYEKGEELYYNPLARPEDVAQFRMEGRGSAEFPQGTMELHTLTEEDILDNEAQQKTNIVFWCDRVFPADILVEFDFLPVREPGLAILFFAATGAKGEDLFDPALAERNGDYAQYHHGDINCFHLAYYRRKYDTERHFSLCNLRKSYGANLVCQAPNPIPETASCLKPYHLTLVKCGDEIAYYIDDLPIFCWKDDGKRFGPLLGGGRIGFRQMSPGIFQYSDLRVSAVKRKPEWENSVCRVDF